MSKLARLKNDMGALFGIEGLQDDLIEASILGVSAAGAIVLGVAATEHLPWLKDQSKMVKAGAMVVAGAAGGIVIGRYANRSAGTGFAAGLIGYGFAKLLGSFIPATTVSLPGLQDSFAGALAAPHDDYFANTGTSEEQLLLGDAGMTVREVQRLGNAGPITIREGGQVGDSNIADVSEAELGAWIQ